VVESCADIVVENPAKDPSVRPLKGNNAAVELLVGRKIVVSGPATFPLWPGQRAKVVGGHELREDEYLVVRVYDGVQGDERPIGTEIVVRGYQSKDALCKPECRANGRDVTFPDGRKLFMGSSGTGAPKDGSDQTEK